jgi:hypothetical protein
MLEALPESQDHIRYSQPKSKSTSTSRKRLEPVGRLTTSHSAEAPSARALSLVPAFLESEARQDSPIACLPAQEKAIICTVNVRAR